VLGRKIQSADANSGALSRPLTGCDHKIHGNVEGRPRWTGKNSGRAFIRDDGTWMRMRGSDGPMHVAKSGDRELIQVVGKPVI